MSYIRCLSNPEALYVYGDGEKTWFLWQEEIPADKSYIATTNYGDAGWSEFFHVENKCHHMIGVPSNEVEEFFLKLHEWEKLDYKDVDIDHPFSHGNMSVVECHILTGDDEGEWRIKLTLGPNLPDLIMWKVTWEYLKNSFYNHIPNVPWYRKWIQNLKRSLSWQSTRKSL